MEEPLEPDPPLDVAAQRLQCGFVGVAAPLPVSSVTNGSSRTTEVGQLGPTVPVTKDHFFPVLIRNTILLPGPRLGSKTALSMALVMLHDTLVGPEVSTR